MHPDELHQRIAELVADNAERATPPPVAVIRRRGHLRRARLAWGVVVVAVLVAGLLVIVRPLGELVAPTPRVPPATQPPRPPTWPARVAPKDVADWARDQLAPRSVGQVILLDRGDNGALGWRIVAASAISSAGRPQVCLLWRSDESAHAQPGSGVASRSSGRAGVTGIPLGGEGFACGDQDARPSGAPGAFDDNDATLPAFGSVSEGAVRVRLLRERRSPVEVDAIDAGAGFKRRFWVLARPGARIVGVVAVDADGRQLTRYP